MRKRNAIFLSTYLIYFSRINENKLHMQNCFIISLKNVINTIISFFYIDINIESLSSSRAMHTFYLRLVVILWFRISIAKRYILIRLTDIAWYIRYPRDVYCLWRNFYQYASVVVHKNYENRQPDVRALMFCRVRTTIYFLALHHKM